MSESTDHHSEFFKSRYAELSPKFLDYDAARAAFKQLVSKDDSLVEIGIGSGTFAVPLIQEGYKIDGVEPDQGFRDNLEEILSMMGEIQCSIHELDIGQFAESAIKYNGAYSHSGPIFFTEVDGKIYFEGLAIDKLDTDPQEYHVGLLRNLVQNNTRLLLNIQENRTGITLSDGSTFSYGTAREGYDLEKNQVTKWFRFTEHNGSVKPNGGEGSYTRFSTSLYQLREMLDPLSIKVNEDRTWACIQNSSFQYEK